MIQRASIQQSTRPMSIHEVARGLVLVNGLSIQEAAIRSGVSPGSVAALCERTPQQIETWLRLLGAFGASLSIECLGRQWSVSIPKSATPRIAQEWKSWRHRRLVSAFNHFSSTKMKRSERDAKAQSYVTNEESRLRDRLTQLRSELKLLTGRHKVDGLREAAQTIANKASLKAEELSLLAGVSLGASQLALGDDQDGRLATLHRLLSALNARIIIKLAGLSIEINLCAPGEWRPGKPEEPSTARLERPSARLATGESPNRSRITPQKILGMYDQGLSIGEIARKAGVSRQRVHKIAMDNGRQPRRIAARDLRIAEGRDTLAITGR
jgi:hypothetical protein